MRRTRKFDWTLFTLLFLSQFLRIGLPDNHDKDNIMRLIVVLVIYLISYSIANFNVTIYIDSVLNVLASNSVHVKTE